MAVFCVAAVTAALAYPPGAGAGLITIDPPPAAVGLAVIESSVDAFGFVERTEFVLPSDVTANITAAGTYDEVADLTPGTIAAGTPVNSYFFWADSVGGAAASTSFTLEFAYPILGIMTATPQLLESTPTLGAAATAYNIGIGQLDLNPATPQIADVVTLDPSRLSLTIQIRTTTNWDPFRVVTAPEPGTAATATIAATLACFRRGRRRAPSLYTR